MAANCSRRAAQFTSTLFTRPSASASSSSKTSAASKLRSLGCSKPSSTPRLAFANIKHSRLLVELGGVQSMMPLHSVTASALLNSLLSSTAIWGTLSEGLATPL